MLIWQTIFNKCSFFSEQSHFSSNFFIELFFNFLKSAVLLILIISLCDFDLCCNSKLILSSDVFDPLRCWTVRFVCEVHSLYLIWSSVSRPGNHNKTLDSIAPQDSGFRQGNVLYLGNLVRYTKVQSARQTHQTGQAGKEVGTRPIIQRGRRVRQGSGRQRGLYTGDQSAKVDKSDKEKATANSYGHRRSR